MKQERFDVAAFMIEVLKEDRLVWTLPALMERAERVSSKRGYPLRRSLTRLLGRMQSEGMVENLLGRFPVFTEAEAFREVAETAEAKWLIMQELFRASGKMVYKGGFDILFHNEGVLDAPPRVPVMFGEVKTHVTTDALLLSLPWRLKVRLDVHVVPRRSIDRGALFDEPVRGSKRFLLHRSTKERALEDALWLTKSMWGKRTGLGGQSETLERLCGGI